MMIVRPWFIATLVALATLASAATHVVSPGTLTAVNSAIGGFSLSAGDTIQFSAGVYTGCGTAINSIPTNVALFLVGDGTGATVFDCASTGGSVFDLQTGGPFTANVELSGVAFRNLAASAVLADFSGAALVASNVLLTDVAGWLVEYSASQIALTVSNVATVRSLGCVKGPNGGGHAATAVVLEHISHVAFLTPPASTAVDYVFTSASVVVTNYTARDATLGVSSGASVLTAQYATSVTGFTVSDVTFSSGQNCLVVGYGVATYQNLQFVRVTGAPRLVNGAHGSIGAGLRSYDGVVVADSVITYGLYFVASAGDFSVTNMRMANTQCVKCFFSGSYVSLTDSTFDRIVVAAGADAAVIQVTIPAVPTPELHLTRVVITDVLLPGAVPHHVFNLQSTTPSGMFVMDDVTVSGVVFDAYHVLGQILFANRAFELAGDLTVTNVTGAASGIAFGSGGYLAGTGSATLSQISVAESGIKFENAVFCSGSPTIAIHDSDVVGGASVLSVSHLAVALTGCTYNVTDSRIGAGGHVLVVTENSAQSLGGNFFIARNTLVDGAAVRYVPTTASPTIVAGTWTIVDNVVTNGNGGGLEVSGTENVAIGPPMALVVEGNRASGHGGGVWVTNTGTTTVTGASVRRNVAESGLGGGVATASGAGHVTLVSCVVAGNTASSGLGSGIAANTTVELSATEVSSNVGVGASVFVGPGVVFNASASLVTGNTAMTFGAGGLFVADGGVAGFGGGAGVCGNSGPSCEPNTQCAATGVSEGLPNGCGGSSKCARGTPTTCAVGTVDEPCSSCDAGWGPMPRCHVILNCVSGALCAAGCTECAPGYALNDDGLTCTQCAPGRFLVSSSAVCGTCDAPCTECAGSASACTACPPLFFLSGSSCLPLPSQLVVKGGVGGVTVTSGDTTPTFTDGTYLLEVGPSTSQSSTLLLSNGNAQGVVISSVSLAAVSDAAGLLSLASVPPAGVLGSGSTSVVVAYAGSSTDTVVRADVTIAYTDATSATRTHTFRVAARTVTCTSPAVVDNCGVCSGPGTGHLFDSDVDVCNVCFGGGGLLDECGVCSGGNAAKDACGVCYGDGTSCAGCDGVPNSGKVVDLCGECDGDGSSCLGCDGVPVPLGGAYFDACGVCGGGAVGNCLTSCDNTSSVPVFFDCAGVCNGTASTDECGVCSGGTTGVAPGIHDAVCGVCFGQCDGCTGGPSNVTDACGICGGTNLTCSGCDGFGGVFDRCGVCAGNESTCIVPCDGEPGSIKQFDCEGQCGGSASLDTCSVCTGGLSAFPPANFHLDVCGQCFRGNADRDTCGVCFGNDGDRDTCGLCFGNDVRMDTCGVCFGSNRDTDACGVCFGNSTSCIGCDFVRPAPGELKKAFDECGVCDGTNACLASATGSSQQYLVWVVSGSAVLCILCLVVIVVTIYLKRRELTTQHETTIREAAAADAPEGIITLMLTDVESSTKLWEKYPTEMVEAMDLHNSVFRELIKTMNGYEVRTEGDAFIIAFQNAIDAAACAIQLQGALLEAPWPPSVLSDRDLPSVRVSEANSGVGASRKISDGPAPSEHHLHPSRAKTRMRTAARIDHLEDMLEQEEEEEEAAGSADDGEEGTPLVVAGVDESSLYTYKPSEWLFRGLRVRVGLHTCRPERVFDERTHRFNYIGPDMIQAQTIGDAGHGGQTVVSHTTRTALRDSLPEGATLTPLGRYQFEGVKGVFPLFSLDAKLLQGRTFPALRARKVKGGEDASRDIITMLLAASREPSDESDEMETGASDSTTRLRRRVGDAEMPGDVQVLDDMYGVSDSHARMRRKRKRVVRNNKVSPAPVTDQMFAGDGDETAPNSRVGSRGGSRAESRAWSRRNSIESLDVNLLAPPGVGGTRSGRAPASASRSQSRSQSRRSSIASRHSDAPPHSGFGPSTSKSKSKSRSRSRSRSRSPSRSAVSLELVGDIGDAPRSRGGGRTALSRASRLRSVRSSTFVPLKNSGETSRRSSVESSPSSPAVPARSGLPGKRFSLSADDLTEPAPHPRARASAGHTRPASGHAATASAAHRPPRPNRLGNLSRAGEGT